MKKQFDFYFDVVSPASYLAWTQLERVIATTQAELVYRPVFLAGVFKAAANPSPLMNPKKNKYILHDFLRYAEFYRVPMQINAAFPFNTLLVMRLLCMLEAHTEQYTRIVDALFRAAWVENLNIADIEVVTSILQNLDLDAQALLDLAQTDQAKAQLAQRTEDAVARGVFGAPTFFVGDEMFFGQDRLDFVIRTLNEIK